MLPFYKKYWFKIAAKSEVSQFVFEDVPVSEVFDAIGKAYGIETLYDEELLKGCQLTATLRLIRS